jgi:hypothetical protein
MAVNGGELACFCFSWPCMHTRDSDIEFHLRRVMADRGCVWVLGDEEIAQERTRLSGLRDARVKDRDTRFGWRPNLDLWRSLK